MYFGDYTEVGGVVVVEVVKGVMLGKVVLVVVVVVVLVVVIVQNVYKKMLG